MKKYLIFYFIASAIIVLLFGLSFCSFPSDSIFDEGIFFENINKVALYLNVAIIIIVIVLLIKKRRIDGKIVFPIAFLVFTGFIVIGCFLFNDRVIVPYIHFGYYARLVVYGFTLLNIYTLLSMEKGDKNEEK